VTDRQIFVGRAASAGTALGVLHRIDRDPTAELEHALDRTLTSSLPHPSETDAATLVLSAFDAVAEQLLTLAGTLRADGQTELADIVEVNGYIAQDRDLRDGAIRRLVDDIPPAHAIAHSVHDYAEVLASLGDPTLAERAADVRQVGRRVLAHLAGSASSTPDGPLVLCAWEVGAADLLERDEIVVAAVSVRGGSNSHASIIARSLGIPLLLGADPSLLDLPDGAEILVDSGSARATVFPDPNERASAVRAMDAARRRREALMAERLLPSWTVDGHQIALRANVATVTDAKAAITVGAAGVGLLRTEIPFLEADAWPTEAQHTAVLAPILRKLTGQQVTVRTLDFADDKLPPFLSRGRNGNARLGRGLPLMLAEPAAFADQFRAILAAGANADLRIMIPMVASAAELRACKEILAKCAAELGVAPPPIGAMIELPEAVARADTLAVESDFFSIGSNDLTGQILGLDRRDPAMGPALAAHPRVLRAVADTVDMAHAHRRRVSVCGDAAAHPLVVPLLVGLRCDALSVAPAALDEVRARIRRLDYAVCAEVAREALACTTLDQVARLVEDRCSPQLP
jgi:phosphoenolpyruvate-protein kinase (PTS system EI component)